MTVQQLIDRLTEVAKTSPKGTNSLVEFTVHIDDVLDFTHETLENDLIVMSTFGTDEDVAQLVDGKPRVALCPLSF